MRQQPGGSAAGDRLVLAQIAKKPELEMVSMECSDGDWAVRVPGWAKLGGVSDRVFGTGERSVAEVGLKKHPARWSVVWRTGRTASRRRSPWSRTSTGKSTAGFIRGKYTHEQLMELWPQKCRGMGF